MINLYNLNEQMKMRIVKAKLIDVQIDEDTGAPECTIDYLGIQINNVPVDMQLINSNSPEAQNLLNKYYLTLSPGLYLKVCTGSGVYVYASGVSVDSSVAKLKNPVIVGLVDEYPALQLAIKTKNGDYYTAGRLTTFENAVQTDVDPILTDHYYVQAAEIFKETVSHTYSYPAPEIDVIQNNEIDCNLLTARTDLYTKWIYPGPLVFWQSWIINGNSGGSLSCDSQSTMRLSDQPQGIFDGYGTYNVHVVADSLGYTTHYWNGLKYANDNKMGEIFVEYDFVEGMSCSCKLHFCISVIRKLLLKDLSESHYNAVLDKYSMIVYEIRGHIENSQWDITEQCGFYSDDIHTYFVFNDISYDQAVNNVGCVDGVDMPLLSEAIDDLYDDMLNYLNSDEFKLNIAPTTSFSLYYHPVLNTGDAYDSGEYVISTKYPYFIRKIYTTKDCNGHKYISYQVYNAIPEFRLECINGVTTFATGLAGTQYGWFGTYVNEETRKTDLYSLNIDEFSVYSDFKSPYEYSLLSSYSIISHSICGTLMDSRFDHDNEIEIIFLKFDDDYHCLYLSTTNDGKNMTVIWIEPDYTIKRFSLPFGFLSLLAPLDWPYD